ncbi:MAG: thioesterase domain-containing protein, partial [Rhodobacteraceae bacterium]|nr:thioesterase domain-containing protein [Paracoccaceae bacterium]
VLVGWSFGAMVAFQIASDLQHAGRTVPKLVLIDPPAIGHHASEGLPLETVVAHELASLGASRSPDQEPGFRDSMALACQLNARAMVAFSPNLSLPDCDAHLFVAKEGEAPPPPFTSRAQWLRQSWQACFGRCLTVHPLSADHYSIMTASCADQITRTLNGVALHKQMDETLL